MEDFIERSKAIGVLNKLAKDNFTVRDVFSFYIGALLDAADGIKQLPSVDAVKVVRCEDCKHYHPTYCEIWSRFGTMQTREKGYCYMGERKDGIYL